MSDKSEGPGWWIASDGKWYPPELHPSVRDDSKVTASATAVRTQPDRRQPERSTHVGPQFPDLFQKAMEGSHVADNISVKYDGDDRRNSPRPVPGGSPASVGSGSGSSGKRRWRKGH
jgi:hypothetical protein